MPQYIDKTNRVYKIINDRPFMWGHILGWQKSAIYQTERQLFQDGDARIANPLQTQN